MAKVFVNDDIFTSDSDYIIGGFETEKVTDFTYADFVAALNERVENLLQDFISRTILIEINRGNEENAVEKANNDVALIISDNLRTNPEFYDFNTFVKTIINNDKTQSWLLSIKENVKDYEPTNVGLQSSIYNQGSQISEVSLQYQNAKMWTTQTTFEQFIEEVSSIEL
jgi:hypothetical protein